MNCDSCIQDAAASLSAIAGDLSSGQVKSLFLAMFPEPNCRMLAHQFVQLVHVDECVPAPRRPPANVTVMRPAICAVA